MSGNPQAVWNRTDGVFPGSVLTRTRESADTFHRYRRNWYAFCLLSVWTSPPEGLCNLGPLVALSGTPSALSRLVALHVGELSDRTARGSGWIRRRFWGILVTGFRYSCHRARNVSPGWGGAKSGSTNAASRFCDRIERRAWQKPIDGDVRCSQDCSTDY